MLKVIGLDDVSPGLPQIVPLDTVEVRDIGLLIIALGFEDRLTACLDNLVDRKVTVDRAIVWEYPPTATANELNRPRLLVLLERLGARVEFVRDVDTLEDVVQARVNSLPIDDAVVALDLSVMTGRLALACVDALSRAERSSTFRVIALYAEAETYLPSHAAFTGSMAREGRVESLGHDEGVLNVDATANLRGHHDPQLRDLVVVFPGFSRDRVRAAISYVNPALLLSADETVRWALSVPHLDKDRWRESAMREIHGITDANPVDRVSTFDYRSVYAYLEELFDAEWLMSNLSIVFLGSKLQSLAVGLFCSVRRGVRVIVSAPENYSATGYTGGVHALWAVDFDDWPATSRNLARVGSVQFVG